MALLENQISANNKAGKQEISQDQLLKILSNKDLTKFQQSKVNLLLATTFRSINDYSSAINYLKKAKIISSDIIGEDSLKMNIKAEMAFAYFDNRKYDKSNEIIQQIKKENYQNLDPTNHAYIIMQEGYINFLQGKYPLSEKLYQQSLPLLKKNSPCDQPVVMVKQMQLNAALNNFEKVDEIYKNCIKISDYCAIIKYKIYATEELITIYQRVENKEKVLQYKKTLDKLNEIYNRENKLSEMHVSNQNFLEKETETEKTNSTLGLILTLILGTALVVSAIIYFKNNKKHHLEKLKFEEELKSIKQELQVYAEAQFSQIKSENNILKSEKLNARQKKLLELVAKGFSNREIAEKLSITEATVKYHLGNIYAILDIKNRKEIFGKIIDN
ncbi:LuxR family transcriptional regulator [Halpernia frigidisoli]|uniref:LuxR family transcriptional regulator n=1 Tax=Halpernia frigidisoli TaxID=1125876 RepID=UPI0015A51F9F|nr:LuxR family transcriptional regulator [Halpernia frigidisoli]